MKLRLRPYQKDALAAIERELGPPGARGRVRSTLLVLATGTGKSLVAATLVRGYARSAVRALVLTHRSVLIDQISEAISATRLSPTIERGKDRAKSRNMVTIASTATLRGDRLLRFARDHFGLIVVDEAHRALGRGHLAILDYFSSAKVLGLTATPDRLDGRTLGEAFESIAYRLDLRAATAGDWLAPITAERVVLSAIDLSRVPVRRGDLAPGPLAQAMLGELAVHDVAAAILARAGARKTIVFCVNRAHARSVSAELDRMRPGCARALDSKTHEDERAAGLVGFAAGAFQFLVNCELLVEGYDVPDVGCVVLARPTKSLVMLSQMIGRGTRKAPGKTDVLVVAISGPPDGRMLVGPGDVLAGRILPVELGAQVNRALEAGPVDLETALSKVDKYADDHRELALEAVARYLAELDELIGAPISASASVSASEVTGDGGGGAFGATDTQLARLGEAGVDLSGLPVLFSTRDAQRILARLEERGAAGLCSYKQARELARAGVDPREVTAARAGELGALLDAAGRVPWALRGQPEAAAYTSAWDALTFRAGPAPS